MEVIRPVFVKIWNEALQQYYKEELGLDYINPRKPPYSINQVLGNNSSILQWPKTAPAHIKSKRQFPAYIRDKADEKSSELGDRESISRDFEFSGSTYRDRYDEIVKNEVTRISTSEEFLLALSRALDYNDFDSYCIAHGINMDSNNIESTTEKRKFILALDSLTYKARYLILLAGFVIGAVIATIGWFLIPKTITRKGYIIRQVADTTTLAKGIVGNWYSYNRTYEARGKTDGYVFNRVAWQIAADEYGSLIIKRHWKAMEFDGWTEVIDGPNPQLHFFVNVYQAGIGRQTPIGYRHFICGLWGENRDWVYPDTLSCVCTTYSFGDSKIGEPLASREVLIRQPHTLYESLKRGSTSLTSSDAPWLEKFLPKGKSYIYQKPK